MTTLLTIQPPEGSPYPLAIDGTQFVTPDDRVTDEIETGHLWALPGLADAHAHLTMTSVDDMKGISEESMLSNIPVTTWAHVERGVLLVLDKGGNTDATLVTLDHDADLRPYVEIAGAMIHPAGGYMPNLGAEVEPHELVEHIRSTATTDGGWIKIVGDWPRKGLGPVNNYPLDILTEAVRIVHDAGARVAVHTMAQSASDAVAAGVDSIEHGPFLTEEDIRALAARGGAWVPTIGNMRYWVDALGPESTGGKLMQAGLDCMEVNLPLAEEIGLTVLAGTDLVIPHGEIATEAGLLRRYGLSDRAATIAASTAAYAYVGRGNSLREGSTADAVFFARNPFEDVEVLDEPELIIRRGRVIRERL